MYMYIHDNSLYRCVQVYTGVYFTNSTHFGAENVTKNVHYPTC